MPRRPKAYPERDSTVFYQMLKLTMTATCSNKKPTVLLDHAQDFANFHSLSISRCRSLRRVQYFCGITFDLSEPPKAGPLEGRVRRRIVHVNRLIDASVMALEELVDCCQSEPETWTRLRAF